MLHEDSQRRIVVSANVAGRDLGKAVADIEQRIASRVQFPSGYFINYGGQFESQRSASRTLGLLSLLSFAGGVYDAPAPSPASQDEAAAYEVAPEPTKAAEQQGGRWRGGVVTKWREHYVTETVYVTVAA